VKSEKSNSGFFYSWFHYILNVLLFLMNFINRFSSWKKKSFPIQWNKTNKEKNESWTRSGIVSNTSPKL
jgi:hypothetical protein